MTLRWLDLYIEGDPHPRRFDRLDLLLAYLRRVERLDDAALEEIGRVREVGPPLARRSYRIDVLDGPR